MRQRRGRNRFDVTTGKPSRGYIIFVVAMAGFLVIGSVALIVGTAFEGDPGRAEPQPDERPGEEVARLQTRIAEDPTDTNSMAVLANILANSGQLDESIGWYEQAVRGNPENGDLRLAFGLALFQLGNDFDAAIQLRRAHELMPDSASPAYYLGQINQRGANSDLDAAREWYETAIEIAPDSLVAEQAQARLDELDSPAPTSTP